jgi:hypothetical protein
MGRIVSTTLAVVCFFGTVKTASAGERVQPGNIPSSALLVWRGPQDKGPKFARTKFVQTDQDT